jgi:hypothetical protein
MIAALGTSLASCGSLSDKRFDRYVAIFEAQAEARGIDTDSVVLSFAPLEVDRLGECERWPLQPNIIYIDPVWWADLKEDCREALIFHEMGHCALDLDHYSDVPLLQPQLNCVAYAKNKQLELDRLFNLIGVAE